MHQYMHIFIVKNVVQDLSSAKSSITLYLPNAFCCNTKIVDCTRNICMVD